MIYKRLKIKSRIYKIFSIILCIMFFNIYVNSFAAGQNETPEFEYEGSSNASVLINNMDYSDVVNSNTWAREAIYETSAFDIIKGYGNKTFGLENNISNQEAIALIYRIAGREEEAQVLAEVLDNAKLDEEKIKAARDMWSYGYLQLAVNDGLISAQDLADALTLDQTQLTPTSFYKSAPAQRQDMAVWLAKILGLEPVYGQQKIFNSFNDWESADPLNVPYIESILVNNIINGDENGNFFPNGNVTREQAAQIVKNAEGFILPILQLEKKAGTIESIYETNNLSQGKNISGKNINVRNSNGKIHTISVSFGDKINEININEQTGNLILNGEKELIVYKNNSIGKSNTLANGDKIKYFVSKDNKVVFVNVISNEQNTQYLAAKIKGIDKSSSQLNILPLLDLDEPYLDLDKNNYNFNNTNRADTTYTYSNNVSVQIDNESYGIDKLEEDSDVILTLENNIVKSIKIVDLTFIDEESGIVSGIVEDNNPNLGYITLYNEDGSGTSSKIAGELLDKRTYNYANQREVETIKNNEVGSIDDIQVGDTVFIKLDDKGNVESISAVDNYISAFGKVLSIGSTYMSFQYDDGDVQLLDIDDSVNIVKGNKYADLSDIEDGDRVKLLLRSTNKYTKVKEVSIADNKRLIANIYKGEISDINDILKKVTINSIQKLNGEKWSDIDKKGNSNIKLGDSYQIYSIANELLDIDTKLKGIAYFAVEKDYGGDEKIVKLVLANEDNYEQIYSDEISNVSSGTGKLVLANKNSNIYFGDGSIIVKNNRLVSGKSISVDDSAKIVSNRNSDTGKYDAGIIKIDNKPDLNFVEIYRGRIEKINEGVDFTLESFSQFDGLNWEYSNTPKTFNLKNSTRIINDTGILNDDEFTDFDESEFVNRSVYVLSDGINAVMVNTAPYGEVNVRGELYQKIGETRGDDSTVLTQPDQIKLINCKLYDDEEYMWDDSDDNTVNILENTIILKDEKIVKPSELDKGDVVRVIKKDTSATGDGYIIIVEN